MGNSAHDFFLSTVKPTVEEALKNPYDVRRARLAAIVLCHMIDHWALKDNISRNRQEMDRLVRETKKELCQKIQDYSLIIDVADASKHAQLAIPKNGSRHLYQSNNVTRTAGLFDAPFGGGYFAEACTVYAILEDGTEKELGPSFQAIMSEWEKIFSYAS